MARRRHLGSFRSPWATSAILVGATLSLALTACRAQRGESHDSEEPGPKPKKPPAKSPEASATASASRKTAPSDEPASGVPPSAASGTPVPATRWSPPNPGRTVIGETNASSVKERWATDIGGWGKCVAVSGVRDEVFATSGHELVVLDARTGAKLRTIAPPCEGILALGPGPASWIVACRRAIVELDPTTLELLSPAASRATRASEAHAAAIAWPGVAMSHKDGVIARYALGGAGPPDELPIGGPPVEAHAIALSRDGRRVAVAFSQGTVWAWDWARPEVPLKLAQYDTRAAVAFSPSGALVLESGPSFGLALHRFGKGGATAAGTLRTDESWTNGLAIDDAGTLAIAGSSGGYLLLAGEKRRALGPHDSIESLAVDEWLTAFAGIDRSGKVRFFAIDPAPAPAPAAVASGSARAAPSASR